MEYKEELLWNSSIINLWIENFNKRYIAWHTSYVMLAATKRNYMRNSFIIVILFFVVQSLVSFADVSEKDVSFIQNDDSVKIIVSNESLNMEKSYTSIQSIKTLLKKYPTIIGSLLGSFFAALIAICSINKTNKNNIKLEMQKYNTQKQINENKYCGLLFSIYSELKDHDTISDLLNDEIEKYLTLISENIEILTESPFSNFQINFMKSCQLKILDFDKFDTELLSLISRYINLIDFLNKNLNLKRVIDTKNISENEDKFLEGIKEYFKSIRKSVDKLKSLSEIIKNEIPKKIASFPQNDVNFDNLKSELFGKEIKTNRS